MDELTPYYVKVEAGSGCAKLTYTKHYEVEEPNSTSLTMQPGQVANLTCVLFPLAKLNYVDSGWQTPVTPSLNFTAQTDSMLETLNLPLAPLKYVQEDVSEQKSETQ